MPPASDSRTPLLARHDGFALLDAPAAAMKGLLESEFPAALLASSAREPFGPPLRALVDSTVEPVLKAHDLRLHLTPGSARALTLALYATRSGRSAVALVSADDLTRCVDAIARAAAESLPRGTALALVVEDRVTAGAIEPRRFLLDLGLPLIEPADVTQLRDSMDTLLRLSRGCNAPVAAVVHASLLRCSDTMEMRPNRVPDSVEALMARRRRRPRPPESADVLRTIRRLELNQATGVPSPGERVPVGFIAIGPTATALRHLLTVLRLSGRVPFLQLSALHPLDQAVVARMLSRCERVIVLEPRPGVVEPMIIDVAETMRRGGKQPGSVWGRLLPPDADGNQATFEAGEVLHPSLLARRVVHLLHLIRPSIQVAGQLAPEPPDVELELPERGIASGPASAAAFIRRMLVETDQWLREQRPAADDTEIPPTTLAIDGAVPASAPPRVVMSEIFDPRRFLMEGPSAIAQAARDDRPWLMIVCDVGTEDATGLERLVRGAVPSDRVERVQIVEGSFAEPARLTESLRAAVVANQMTVLIVRDGPPPRFDVAALERSRAEIDRLGFEPRQRVVWPADAACGIHLTREDEQFPEPHAEFDPSLLRTLARVDRLPLRSRSRPRLRLQPLLEEVTVVRTRPPAKRRRRAPSAGLTLPDVIHRKAPYWRAHVAGCRGESPGWMARVIADAGRRMGYAVRVEHEPTSIGPGRRAWAQLLFTRPHEGESSSSLAARTPFGEADLLLGFDATETLRSLRSDPGLRVALNGKTFAVVNGGLLSDEIDSELNRAVRSELDRMLRLVTRPEPRFIDDFADLCRAVFHTDRVADLAMLGVAFQAGLIPVTIEAMEAALAQAEADGCGRALEIFEFGRHLGAGQTPFLRPREEREEDVPRIVRRTAHLLSRQRWRGLARARSFRALLEESVQSMPGLAETDPGRQARRDFVLALQRCYIWGGFEYAERYGKLITSLYRLDRGDTGRALTRNAVLPLATAMLIRDPIYVASMATSAEQRRRTRQRLNVKPAREDELQRRFLTRIELVAFNRRYRADVRTSDWPARLLSMMRHVMALKWRGTRRSRALRDYLVSFVERAVAEADQHYERYQAALLRLQKWSLDDRLARMAPSELRMLAEGVEEDDHTHEITSRGGGESVVGGQ